MNKQLIEKWVCRYQTVCALAKKYGLDTTKLEQAINEMGHYQVTTPLIGGFSTGKSSLLNALLGEELLATDITPETAIPTEISYGENAVTCVTKTGKQSISLDTFRHEGAPKGTTLVQITLDSPVLAEIPSVKIVDMPGFDSGYEIHNRAIDDYLPKSLAYIITTSADEGTLRESILTFLQELKLSQMPAYFLITKADKVVDSDLKEVKKHIAETAASRLTLDKLQIGFTSAADNSIDDFVGFLHELEAQSEVLFVKAYSARLSYEIKLVNDYLTSSLQGQEHSVEQLNEERRESAQQIETLRTDLEEKTRNFERQAEACAETICARVESDLQENAESLENMMAQGSDIHSRVNFIIRNAVTYGIRNELEPMMRKHIRDVSSLAQLELPDIQSDLLGPMEQQQNAAMKSTLKEAAAPIGTAIGAAIGSIVPVIGTAVGAIIGSAVGALINVGIDQSMHEKEMAQRKAAAHQRLEELMRSIRSEIDANVRTTIGNTVAQVNEKLAEEIDRKIENEQKVLDDLMAKLQETEEQRKTEGEQMRRDQAVLGEILA